MFTFLYRGALPPLPGRCNTRDSLRQDTMLSMPPGKRVRGKRSTSVPGGVFTLGPDGPLTPGYWLSVTGGVQRKFQKVKTYSIEN